MTPTERLAALAEGRNPALVLRLPSGFAVMGDTQFLPGYCLLLASPQVAQLNDLALSDREAFLRDMGLLGDAVRAVTGCLRINYSIYGNLDPFLHAHVWPRYATEDDAWRTSPPFSYPAAIRDAPENAFDPDKHQELRRRIREALQQLLP